MRLEWFEVLNIAVGGFFVVFAIVAMAWGLWWYVSRLVICALNAVLLWRFFMGPHNPEHKRYYDERWNVGLWLILSAFRLRLLTDPLAPRNDEPLRWVPASSLNWPKVVDKSIDT